MRFSRVSIAAMAAVMQAVQLFVGQGAGCVHLERRAEGDVHVDAGEVGERHLDRLQERERLSVEGLGGEAGGGAAGDVHGVVLLSERQGAGSVPMTARQG
ncbi:hypothetical protein OHU11_42100 (plasmid) [Streptomyces sp. NBC_00257]|uniref:hypothetical protein n=1 Tax=unclassified Streptomyces TaxID=2593676 RepID=UPI00224F145C|nr:MULTISPECIES: hypothetical protein [unclassified Streptomyces]MCX5434774.1 hypothetical protein [Streptomyces sp. NBC_00062]